MNKVEVENYKKKIGVNSYKSLLKLHCKIIFVKKIFNKIHIFYTGFFNNQNNLKIENQRFFINKNIERKIHLNSEKVGKVYLKALRNIKHVSFKIEDIMKEETFINNPLKIKVEVEGTQFFYNIAKIGKVKNERYYYLPFLATKAGDFVIYFRQRIKGCVTMVVRKAEYPENETMYKILESKFISFMLYLIGNFAKVILKKPINLYFEKFSEKAEEGTFELFTKALGSKESYNYYVIDKKSNDYNKIKNSKNMITKYSLKYYILLYSSSNFITTEAPLHINILRCKNRILQKSIINKKFIFLQHGITYLKAHGKNSSYVKNRQAEPNYIVVSSEKEREVVQRMLMLEEETILLTGMPIFDLIKYNHINQVSEDIVTIMLTWKPYEEHIHEYEKTTYYQYTLRLYEMLSKYVDKDKIKIVVHPKIKEQMLKTKIKNLIYDGKISEILEKTKLLITDYSSVCYNSFYQGGGVIFYQEDLELYEEANGQLIPNEDEYIGYRVFNIKDLENHIKNGLKNGNIDLQYYRKQKFVDNYKTINEFNDGKNVDRIYKELKGKNII